MVNQQVPKRLWGMVLLYEAQIIPITVDKYGRTSFVKGDRGYSRYVRVGII